MTEKRWPEWRLCMRHRYFCNLVYCMPCNLCLHLQPEQLGRASYVELFTLSCIAHRNVHWEKISFFIIAMCDVCLASMKNLSLRTYACKQKRKQENEEPWIKPTNTTLACGKALATNKGNSWTRQSCLSTSTGNNLALQNKKKINKSDGRCNGPFTQKIKTAGISRHVFWLCTSGRPSENVPHHYLHRIMRSTLNRIEISSAANQANGWDFIFVCACMMDGWFIAVFCFTVQLAWAFDRLYCALYVAARLSCSKLVLNDADGRSSCTMIVVCLHFFCVCRFDVCAQCLRTHTVLVYDACGWG